MFRRVRTPITPIVNSAADWGISDPLKVPKTIAVMRAQGIAEETIARIVWDNPVAFFAQSGRLASAQLEVAGPILYGPTHPLGSVVTEAALDAWVGKRVRVGPGQWRNRVLRVQTSDIRLAPADDSYREAKA